jgi:DNA-directed RNA polymerase subunit omega
LIRVPQYEIRRYYEASPGGSSMPDKEPLQNKYSLVKGAARRARQLQSGAPPLGVSNSIKACRVAQDEIRVGKVTYTVLTTPLPPASL